MNEEEAAQVVKEVTQDFNKWFNEEVSARPDAHLGIVPEIIAVLYLRFRIWKEREDAERVMRAVIDQCEHLIEEKALHIHIMGEEVPFRVAEDFESDEDREFWIQASWGITDEDFDQLLGG